ncbi:facilitated trehalose transporter Tret1-like [Oratosquilla oratoria]|uniref:facilitated trehalose transporter Tret1-like n=1 Tax=Oratosquilla oratoria TaxID=337810 RepID=UPI003F775E86
MFSIVVAGCMLIMGNVVAWPNVITVLIDSNNNNTSTNVSALLYSNDFVLTEEEAGWIASLPTISNIPFVLLSGLIVNLVGLKGSTALGLVLAIVAWLLMGLILSKSALFIGRAISGVALAFIMTVSQSLMNELVSPRIRGFTASLPKLFVTLGSLEINVADIFLPWNIITVLCASAYSVLFIFILFVPESPYWLVKKGRKDAAVSALKLLYPSADDVEEYFQEVQNCVTLSSEKLGVREQIRQMRLSTNYKPVTLMTIVFACYGSNGYSIILPYSTLLFSQSGMVLDPRLCTIILGITRSALRFLVFYL